MPHAFARTVTLAIVALLAGDAVALAARSGGAAVPDAPQVTAVRCVSSAALACASQRTLVRGGGMRIAGRGLRRAKRIVFEGARGRRDDVATRPRRRSEREVEADVPSGARSGPITVIDELGREATAPQSLRVGVAPPMDVAPGTGFYVGARRKPTLTLAASSPGVVQVEVVSRGDQSLLTTFIAPVVIGLNAITWDGFVAGRAAPSGVYVLRVSGLPASATPPFALVDHLFPIRGKHDLGRSKTNQFGGGRGHQGTDMFARCGTPLAAARGGKVRFAGYHSRAGNYVVIDGQGTGIDYVYMHMRRAPLVSTGQLVFTGQKLGEVGDSGHASGCHLHFELWSAPGWQAGGRPFDALPSLKVWERYGEPPG